MTLDGKRLLIKFNANASNAKGKNIFQASYTSVCRLVGDFDIQTNFSLIQFPSRNGVRLGLGAGGANIERTSIPDKSGVDSVYVSDFSFNASPIIYTETTDTSGKLRLQRVGNSISSFYFDAKNNNWIKLQANENFTLAPVEFAISSWSHDEFFGKRTVKIAFDNVIINSGTCE